MLPRLGEATTWFVRTGGSTTTNCTGTTNADYPGSGTGQACAYSNLQDAIGASTFGDTIKLHAGQSFSGNFNLTNKGTPPTGTDADFITITTDDTSGTPAALSAYSNGALNEVRITTAMAANMPKVKSNTGDSAINVVKSAKYWRVERLDITNVDSGVNVVRLISSDTANAISAVSEYPDHIDFRLNWIHPIEETGTDLSGFTTTASSCSTTSCTFASVAGLNIGDTIYILAASIYNARTISNIAGNVVSWVSALPGTPGNGADVSKCSGNLCRTAQNAIYFEGTNVTVRQNAIQGFVGRTKYGSTEAGQRMTSSCYLVGTYSDTVAIENNLLECWTYAVFFGGSQMPTWLGTSTATVSSCSSTACTFSNTTGLSVGDPVSAFASSAPLSGCYPNQTGCWGTGFVTNISGSVVTVSPNWCHSFDGNNTCVDMGFVPSNGDQARWNGYLPNNITVRRNLFIHRPEWTALMYGDCGGKGYFEVKAATNLTFIGNTFKGCTDGTTTVRNQGGDFAWATLDNLTISSNYFENCNAPFNLFLRDSTPVRKSSNVLVTNNLCVGLVTSDHDGNSGGVFANNFQGGNGVTITHNTVTYSKTSSTALGSPSLSMHKGFVTFKQGYPTAWSTTTDNFVFKDNLVSIAPNYAFEDARGIAGVPISDVWPSATVTNNIFVNTDGHDTSGWSTPYPSNTYLTTWANVGFTTAPSALDATGNYRLTGGTTCTNGNWRTCASDGTDPGVNFTTLINELGYDPNGGAVAPPPPSDEELGGGSSGVKYKPKRGHGPRLHYISVPELIGTRVGD